MNKNIIKFLSVAMLVIAIAGSYYFPKVLPFLPGAVATLDGVDNPYVTVNGHREWRGRIPMMASSSVICDFDNGKIFNATSTVEVTSALSTNTGIAAANSLLIATTTNASKYATTTSNSWNKGFAMGTGKWFYDFVKNSATTTDGVQPQVLEGMEGDGSSNYILKPTEHLIWIIGTTTAGTFVTYDQGFCSAVIREI